MAIPYRLQIAGVLTAALFSASTMLAQSPNFTVEADASEATIAPSGAMDFHLTVKNISSSKISINVYRLTNTLPSEEWTSALCFGGLCYSPDMDSPPSSQIEAGKELTFQLTVNSGSVVGQSAIVELSMSQPFDTHTVVKSFKVTTSNAGGVDISQRSTASRAYPNPATSYSLLPLPATLAGSFEMGLFNSRGEKVTDLTGDARDAAASGEKSVRLDVSALSSGAYFYRVSNNGVSTTGTLMVTR